jgi:phosphoglucomutase
MMRIRGFVTSAMASCSESKAESLNARRTEGELQCSEPSLEYHWLCDGCPATPEQKTILQELSPEYVSEEDLAGDRILAKLTTAPGNNAPTGGPKIATAMGWFATRPSGTENIYKIYAESFRDEDHRSRILSEARQIVNQALDHSGEQP